MKINCLMVLLALLAPAAEETADIAALYTKAIAEKKTIATWYYNFTVPFTAGGRRFGGSQGWVKGKPETKPGDIFRIDLAPDRQAPCFTVSQITGPKTFLDFRNKFLVEGLETDGLVDGKIVQDFPVFTKIGFVKGSHTYETESGTNTVLHIILIESPEFTLTAEEEKDGYRVWTVATGGTKSVGKIIRRTGSRFKIMDRNGKQHTVSSKDFSEEDQKFLEEFKP